MKRRRVFVEDSRRNGLYLRVTWHADERQFVVSTWQDEVCTGAVRLPVERASELVALFADGLADAAATPAPAPEPARPQAPLERLRRWLRLPSRRRVADPGPAPPPPTTLRRPA